MTGPLCGAEMAEGYGAGLSGLRWREQDQPISGTRPQSLLGVESRVDPDGCPSRRPQIRGDAEHRKHASLGSVPPQSLTGKALYYLNAQWPKLVRVLDDGRIPLDTGERHPSLRAGAQELALRRHPGRSPR